jgi:hypothetical protein
VGRRALALSGDPETDWLAVRQLFLNANAPELKRDDGDLDALFEKALRHRPSLVLLEDLDRAFPTTGETRSNVSIQQLLDCLDGVATGEGL